MAAATHFRVSQDMKARLGVLAQDQADGNNLAFETKTIVRDIETRTAEMHLSLSHDSEITAQMQTRVEAIERMTTELLDQRSMGDAINLIPTDLRDRERLVKDFANSISNNVVHDVRQYLQRTYIKGLILANLPTPEKPCQCCGHESQAAPDNNSACSVNLSRKSDTLRQTQDSSADPTWTRQTRNTTTRFLIRNRLLGTLELRTTTTTYSCRSLNDSFQTRSFRQIWHTKITYSPAFLCHQGVVVRYSPFKSCGEGGYFVPSPSIHLSTFNVRPWDAEIFAACMELDIGKIQDLFDRGLATPYDVDDIGRNLLGYTVNQGVSEMDLKLEAWFIRNFWSTVLGGLLLPRFPSVSHPASIALKICHLANEIH